MRVERLPLTAFLLPALAAPGVAQLCSIPCAGAAVVCDNQNGIRNHGVGLVAPIAGPNAATGNLPGDAEWKVYGCEHAMSRGSGSHTFVGWEVAVSNDPASNPAGGAAAFDLPDLDLLPVVVNAAGVRVPAFGAPPLGAFLMGPIVVPPGFTRVNVSVRGPGVAPAAACPPPAPPLVFLPNGDVALVLSYAPGETLPAAPGATYSQQGLRGGELNTVLNGGASFSGWVDGLTGAVTVRPPMMELYTEAAFYEPTLEALRASVAAGVVVPTTGSGSRELVVGDLIQFRSEDWEAGKQAIAGVDRLAALLISDESAGSPICLAPPGAPPGFLAGSLLLPGSAGTLALYPTPSLLSFLSFSSTYGLGLNCHAVADTGCDPATGFPSVFTDLRAATPPIPVPPGLGGTVLYAAAFYLNLGTFTLEDGSNTVALLFL